MGSGASQRLCWPGQSQAQLVSAKGLACYERPGGLWFSIVCALVGEAGPEARAGFLEGRARAQGILELMPQRGVGGGGGGRSCVRGPLVGRAVSRGGSELRGS